MDIKILRRLTRLAVSATVVAAASVAFQTTALAADVGVAVNLSVPGLYGQVTLGGDVPTPELILPRAVVAMPPRVVVAAPPPPMYLHVPPGYERHWERHCREYDACGRPVYFVSERWYHDVYRPHHEFHEHEHEMRRDEHLREEQIHHEEQIRHEERAHEEHEMRRHEEAEHYHDHDHDHDHGHDHDHEHDHDHDRDHR